MSDKNFFHKEIVDPKGSDKVSEAIQKAFSELCFVSNSFGRVSRQVIDGKRRPLYFNRSGDSVNFNYIDLSLSREFATPSYSFVYPYGVQTVKDEEETGNIYFIEQRFEVILIINYKLLNLQNQGINHIAVEEIKQDALGKLRALSVVSDISATDDYKEVFSRFDLDNETFLNYPYGCIKFEFLATFENCEGRESITCL